MTWFNTLKQHLPWYGWLDKKLAPLNSGLTVILIVLAVVTVWIALYAARPAKLAWIIYWVSP